MLFKCIILINWLILLNVYGSLSKHADVGQMALATVRSGLRISNQRHKPETDFSQNDYSKAMCRHPRNAFSVKQNASTVQLIKTDERPTRNDSSHEQRPLFASSKNRKLPLDPALYKCKQNQSAECLNKTKFFRNKILREFQKSVDEELDTANYYNVEYALPDEMHKYQPVCMALNAKVRVLTKNDSPFDRNKIGRLFPSRRMFGRRFTKTAKSCVIVSSAGSMFRSGLGKFIDAHDVVMRFNHAPVRGYENDVGAKTTIRVVNSQVVSKPEFNFIDTPIFQNVTIAAWDSGKYNATLSGWLSKPDFQLFKNYKRFMKKHSNAKVYLVDPRSIWNLWKTLHIFTGTKIRRNPPSSGFIGLALLLPFCSYVDIVEYMPSTRLNGRCHYYDNEINPACTFGAWHPLAAEKLMAFQMNTANDYSVFQYGALRIRQPIQNGCKD